MLSNVISRKLRFVHVMTRQPFDSIENSLMTGLVEDVVDKEFVRSTILCYGVACCGAVCVAPRETEGVRWLQCPLHVACCRKVTTV